MAEEHVVLSAIGADRVGIVDELTAIIEAYECNIKESRMAVLGGDFAVIMLIVGEASDVSRIIEEADTVGEQLKLYVEARLTETEYRGRLGRPYLIETFSLDAPGIVHAVSAVLHKHGVNIEDLETDTSAAPWTGAAMFHMRAHIIVPPTVSVSALREELSMLEQKRDLDITMRPVSINWTEK